MADEIRTFQVTTPAGTLAIAPLLTRLTMPPRRVKEIEVVIPEGCNGVVGFAFGSSSQIIIPYNAGGWIVGSGETLTWAIDPRLDSGAWEVQSWNIGHYPHTIYIRFMLEFIILGQPAVNPEPIPATSLTTMTPSALLDLVTPFGSETFVV